MLTARELSFVVAVTQAPCGAEWSGIQGGV